VATNELIVGRTLEAAFLSLLFATLDKSLVILHLVQHAVEAQDSCTFQSQSVIDQRPIKVAALQ